MKKINEGPISSVKKFTDKFFDSLKDDATDKVLSKAKKVGMEKRAIQKMEQIKKEKEELERILSQIPDVED